MKVGTRELKNHLSQYLRKVEAGETIFVTDRGRIVAELKPSEPAALGEQSVWRELAADDLVSLGTGHYEDFAPVSGVRKGRLASRMILEDRD